MINLITSLYYYSDDYLINCLFHNLESEYISDVYLYCNNINLVNNILNRIGNKYYEKVHIVRIGKEPLFSELFSFAINNLNNELCMITNPGIYLEECDMNYINKIYDNIYCSNNNSFIFKTPIKTNDYFIKNIEHIQNINGSFDNVLNNLIKSDNIIYDLSNKIIVKNINSDNINYSSSISLQKYSINNILLEENEDNTKKTENPKTLKVKLDKSIIDHFFCNEYYSMISLEQFLLYFLKGNSNIYNFTILNDSFEKPDICIWEIRHQVGNESLYDKNVINILISLENLPYWNFHDYKHFLKYREYDNPYMDIYFYNHISSIIQTDNYLAIPMINLFINHYLLYNNEIKPSYSYTHFNDKKFCLIINKSGLNKDIQNIKKVLEKIGEIDNISMYNDIILNKSCYHFFELLNIFNKYKFIICYENSYTDGYVTEKIFNCFYAKTIPIYNGAPNINNYINSESYINPNLSEDELIETINFFKKHRSQKIYILL